ncbi:MAG: hypothetical protein OXG08_03590 [Gammaproteobacteria bacterium]|nr:hypothetical protein [Gammaproteobacteria bacterium]
MIVARDPVSHERSPSTRVCLANLLSPWCTMLVSAYLWATITLVASCSIVNPSVIFPNNAEGDGILVQKDGLHQIAQTEQTALEFEIDESWDLEDTSTLQKILREAAEPIYRHLRHSPKIMLNVGHDRERGPVALYRTRGQTTDTVLLSNTPLEYRPQILYQFAHEFCHVISDYNRLRSTESKNEWFHEALCELASIFVMHGTGERHLKKYIDDYLEESIRELEETEDFGLWLSDREHELREQPSGKLDRRSNAVVAYRLHPLFIRHPEIWNTLKSLPRSDSELREYLVEWKQAVEHQDRGLIDRIAEALLPDSSSDGD